MGLINEALLITNLWVFFYNNLLFYLRLKIPPPSIAAFVVVWPKPEPSEIPLYLILTFVAVIVIYFLHKYFLKANLVSNKIANYVFFAFMLIVFISNLGGYPLKGFIQPDLKVELNPIDYFYLLVYLGSIIFILIEAQIISKLLKNQKKLLLIFGVPLLLILITLFTFEPRFPISPHDYSFFFGPIYEVAQGKTLFTEATSQYGFLSIIFLAFFYKLKLLSFAYLPVFIWFLYVGLYFFCFFLIYKISRSLTLALIGLFSLITLNYFSLYHLPITIPQVGAMRWIPVVLSAILFYWSKRIDAKKFVFLTALLSFWVVDSGLAIILAYFATLFVFFLGKITDLKTTLKAGLMFLFSLILIFAAMNITHVLFGFRSINLAQIFLRLRQYTQAGFGMLPMESQTYFWFVMLVYFSSIIFFFRKEKRDFYDQLLIFIANLSLTSAVYYIGRSHPHNLFHISIFPLLNLFILLSLILKTKTSNLKLFTSIILFVVLIVIPAFNRKEALTKIINTKIEKALEGSVFTSEFDPLLSKRFSREIKLIKENLTDQEVAILSIDDTFLLYLTGKRNLLYNNPQIAATTYEDINFTLQKALKICPEKIAFDCRAINKCPNYAPLNESSIFMPPLLLNRLQEKCGVRYEPTLCTEQLCLAVAQKTK